MNRGDAIDFLGKLQAQGMTKSGISQMMPDEMTIAKAIMMQQEDPELFDEVCKSMDEDYAAGLFARKLLSGARGFGRGITGKYGRSKILGGGIKPSFFERGAKHGQSIRRFIGSGRRKLGLGGPKKVAMPVPKKVSSPKVKPSMLGAFGAGAGLGALGTGLLTSRRRERRPEYEDYCAPERQSLGGRRKRRGRPAMAEEDYAGGFSRMIRRIRRQHAKLAASGSDAAIRRGIGRGIKAGTFQRVARKAYHTPGVSPGFEALARAGQISRKQWATPYGKTLARRMGYIVDRGPLKRGHFPPG